MAAANEALLKNCRLSFPYLWKANKYKETDPDEKARYSAQIMVPKGSEAEASLFALVKGMQAIQKSPNVAVNDGDQPKEGEEEARAPGHWLVNAKSKFRPVICDEKKTPVAEEDGKIYAGCYCNFYISGYQTEKWLSFNLQGVQFARDGEPFGTRKTADEMFGGEGEPGAPVSSAPENVGPDFDDAVASSGKVPF